jgi:FkbM family methyltransferase
MTAGWQPDAECSKLTALKIRMANALASDRAGRLIGAATRNRVRHRGLLFDVRSRDFSPRVRAQMFWGLYEGAETRMIRQLLRGSDTVVELGSSLGVTAAHIAVSMVPGGRLVCVEANPDLIPGLRERTLRLSADLRTEIIHAAITDYCGRTPLAVALQNVDSHIVNSQTSERTVEVPALTLREVLKRGGVSEFDLVSDIEGAEASFLLHDAAVLDGCRRAVLELHPTTSGGRAVSVSDLLNAALATGFSIVNQHGPVVALSRH